MVDNSTSLCERISGWIFVIGRSRQVTSSRVEAPSKFFCWHLHRVARDMTLLPHHAYVVLKRKLAARGKRALRAPSIAGWFCRLPSPVFAAGSVAPPICHL